MTKMSLSLFLSRATILVALTAAGAAHAENVPIEAEGRQPAGSSIGLSAGLFITSPLMIKDSAAASSGSYLEVAAGNNSQNSPPVNEGIARYNFHVQTAGAYRIWARVMAPTTSDDSFWIRVNDLQRTEFGDPEVSRAGAWIKWNGIPLGSAWHWVLVKADGAASPSQFPLVPDDDPNNPPGPNAIRVGHQLELGYREDGTRLDAFLVSSEPTFNPNAALAGVPDAPIMQDAVPGASAHRLSWMIVPGATSYTLERQDSRDFPPEVPFNVIRTGITGHSFTDLAPPPQVTYRIRAVASTGTSTIALDARDRAPADRLEPGLNQLVRIGSSQLSVTPPMRISNGTVFAPVGTNSTGAPPAHGRGRLDFQVAQQIKVKVWANVTGPNGGPIVDTRDSFWVRMDDGPWIKWNNIRDFCDDVHDSDNGGRVVTYTIGPGSHRYEFAHREGGTVLSNRIVITDNLTGNEQCSD